MLRGQWGEGVERHLWDPRSNTAHQSWPATVHPGALSKPWRRDKHSRPQKTRWLQVHTEGNDCTHNKALHPRRKMLRRVQMSGQKRRILKRKKGRGGGPKINVSPGFTLDLHRYKIIQHYFVKSSFHYSGYTHTNIWTSSAPEVSSLQYRCCISHTICEIFSYLSYYFSLWTVTCF